jgi:hypothetical protein
MHTDETPIARNLTVTRTVMFLLLAAVVGIPQFDATAQLGSTNLDGMQVQVTSIYRSGDSRNLDCSLGFRFLAAKTNRASNLEKIEILGAVDDTGRNLVRTNRALPLNNCPLPFNGEWLYSTVGGLKAPDEKAKNIKRLRAEAHFMERTEIPLVLTNFMSQPRKLLRQPLLDQYHIKIVYNGLADEAPPGSLVIDRKADKRISLKIDDPLHKIVSLTFTKPDGQSFPADREASFLTRGANDGQTYCFKEKPPRNVNLALNLEAAKTTNVIRFDIDNVRLPWIDLPVFDVSATHATFRPGKETNWSNGSLTLSFTGGELTNALGIRNLSIQKMEDDSGQPVKVQSVLIRFSALPPTAMDSGRNVDKTLMLKFQSPAPKSIRILKGEAELICPSTNDYVVTINDFMAQPGKPFEQPLLKSNQVRLAYLTAVNFSAFRNDLTKTNWVFSKGPTDSVLETTNTLVFMLEDSRHSILTPWGGHELNFFDSQGNELPITGNLSAGSNLKDAGEIRAYRFKTLPPKNTQLRVCLAVPESLEHVPFEIKNIPLN